MLGSIPLLDRILEWLLAGVIALIELLPMSPIQELTADSAVSQIFGYINWVIPIGRILVIMGGILGATIIWYAVRWVLRFAHYVE